MSDSRNNKYIYAPKIVVSEANAEEGRRLHDQNVRSAPASSENVVVNPSLEIRSTTADINDLLARFNADPTIRAAARSSAPPTGLYENYTHPSVSNVSVSISSSSNTSVRSTPSRNTIVYNPSVTATPENYEAAGREFKQLLANAPKPDEHPNQSIRIAPSITFTGRTINLADYLRDNNLSDQSASSSNNEAQDNSTTYRR
jgi:hypothetical protein